MSEPTLIPERELLYDIENLEKEFFKERGFWPENISHWDCGEPYKRKLLSELRIVHRGLDSDYKYSRGSGELKLCLERLSSGSQGGILLANGTSAVNLIPTVLRASGYSSVLQFDPTYYALRHNWLSLGFSVTREAIDFLGSDNIQNSVSDHDVICVTTPAYSAGRLMPEHVWTAVGKALQENKLVVFDATLATPEHVKSIYETYRDQVILTTTPHKILGINDLKFSITTFPTWLQDAFDQWSGVTSGALPASSLVAIDHFLSLNFGSCLDVNSEFKRCAFRELQDICDKYSNIQLGTLPMDHFVGVFRKDITAELGFDRSFLANLMSTTTTSVIPQVRNGLSQKLGFGIRLNLLRWSERYSAKVDRTVSAMSNIEVHRE